MNKSIFTIVFTFFILSLQVNAGDHDPVFHFNFKDAAGKSEIKDTSGRFRCICKENKFVVQRGALRTAPVAQIYIPGEKLPDISEKLTVSAWILKKATPDATPIMIKGRVSLANGIFLFSRLALSGFLL